MTALTRTELQAAIDKCLGEGFSTQLDARGLVDEKTSKWELLRYAALIILQNPDSIYYLASLYRDDLMVKVDALVESLQTALGAIEDTRIRYTEPNTKYLTTAEDALDRAYNAYSNEKSSPFAVNQAKEAMEAYAGGIESQLVSTGDMANTAAVAKSIIQKAVSDLEDAVAELMVGVDDLTGLSLNTTILDRIFMGVTIARIRSYLSSKKTELEGLTGLLLERELRDFFLFLKTAGKILGSSSNYPIPSDYRFVGTGAPANTLADSADEVEPAALMATKHVPIIVTAANKTFTIEINGTNKSFTLTECEEAAVHNAVPETYNIHDAAQATIEGTTTENYTFPPGGEYWRVYVDGVPFEGTIPAGVYTCVQLITQITGNILNAVGDPLTDWLSVTAVNPPPSNLRFEYDDPAGATTGDHRIIIGGYTAANNIILGAGTDYQDSDDGADPQTKEGMDGNTDIKFLIDAFAEVTVTLTTGAARTALQVANDIDTDPVITGKASSSVYNSHFVEVVSDSQGDGARVNISGGDALKTLGFTLNQIGISAHRRPQEVVSDFNAQMEADGIEAKAYTTAVTRSEGVCTTIAGVGDEAKVTLLPPGEGVNVEAGMLLTVLAGPNAGSYEILLKAGDVMTLDRDQWVTAGPLTQKYVVQTNLLTIESTKIDDLDSSLEALAATLFGFNTTKVWGKVSDLETSDSGLRYVREGDDVLLASTLTHHEVTNNKGTRVAVTPLVDMDMGSTTLSIRSADEAGYSTMKSALLVWKANYESGYPHYGDLMVAVNRLLNSSSYTNRTAVTNQLTTLLAEFTGAGSLVAILEAFECRPLKAAERLLETLEQRGSSRGKELLRRLKFEDFFDFGAQLSHDRYAFDKLVQLMQEYEPVEAVSVDESDDVLELEEISDTELLDDDLPELPPDHTLEPDDEVLL